MNVNGQILTGIRILDFTWVLAGPYATRLLADYGAEVIKVQPVTTPREAEPFDRAYYAAWNRNKLSITLNMNAPEGLELAKQLAAVSDVVIENFTPRVMENWGMNYPVLKEIKPDIIMVSMSAYGRSGPYRDRAGFAPTVHAASGLTAMTLPANGEPVGPGFSWADHIAGLFAANAILGALEKREADGEGSFIDLAEVAAMTYLLGPELMEYQAGGEILPSNRSRTAVQGVYPCQDGWCAVTVTGEDRWSILLNIIKKPEWRDDPCFATLAARLENQDIIDAAIAAWTSERTTAEVMDTFHARGIAAGTVRDAAGLVQDAHLNARGFFIMPPENGKLLDANPVHLAKDQPRYNLPAPEPGRDNRYVFREILGLDEAEIERLERNGIIRSFDAGGGTGIK